MNAAYFVLDRRVGAIRASEWREASPWQPPRLLREV